VGVLRERGSVDKRELIQIQGDLASPILKKTAIYGCEGGFSMRQSELVDDDFVA
jgi:hypothetical protein